MRRCRILALDYGKRNVGLALSDELGLTVTPLPSLPNHGFRDLLRRLQAAVQEHQVEQLVIGLPFNMDGSTGEAVRRVAAFMHKLQPALGLPLHGFDERLSTIEAQEFWKGMNSRQQGKYKTVDSLAAACILQRYLKESD